ncbi:MAG: class A beta-lactamase-related serine hydrolase [Patescibacteria group bacterium]|nr:class A beta-lactamase-related serine hydrolase [Patescibacteria group bacterium]
MNLNTTSKKSKFIRRKIIQCFLALFVLATSSLLIKNNYLDKKDLDIAKEVEAESIQVEVIEVPKEFNPSETVIALENYVTNLSGKYGYSIIDLETSKEYGARQDNKFFMASTCKIAVSAYLYNQIQLGKINPDKKLVNLKKFFEDGTGILQYEEAGKLYKISYLDELMIQKSDNIATNILINYLGAYNIQNFINNSGISGMDILENTTTPKAMSSLLQKIYNNEIISKDSADKLYYLMINSIGDNRLIAGIPANVAVAHKIGTFDDQISDVGIVFLKQRPYVISVYSKKNLKQDIAEIAIAKISKQIFEFQDSNE